MNPIEVLHNAARDYCQKRATQWGTQYSRLIAERRDRVTLPNGGWGYTREALDTFPRYNVLNAILHEIERFVPGDFGSLHECRGFLAAAADTAQSSSTNTDDASEVAAISEERSLFAKFVTTLMPEEAGYIPMLPFRRVLGESEHKQLHRAFVSKWGRWYGGGVKPPAPPSDAVTLHIAAMDTENAFDCLRKALTERGLNRVLELREWGEGYEIDTKAASFAYSGAEGFWTSGEMDWMVYASHESSITFGGSWLVQAMRNCLDDFDRWLYPGWDVAAYET